MTHHIDPVRDPKRDRQLLLHQQDGDARLRDPGDQVADLLHDQWRQSMLMFHCTIVHASPANMSPWDRSIVYLSLNRTDNAIRRFTRPEYVAQRDFAPIVPLADDALTALAREEAVTA